MKRILITVALITSVPVFAAFCGAYSGEQWGLASVLLIVFTVPVVWGVESW